MAWNTHHAELTFQFAVMTPNKTLAITGYGTFFEPKINADGFSGGIGLLLYFDRGVEIPVPMGVF